jgi:energy-converting hydrogenase Eha subunit F
MFEIALALIPLFLLVASLLFGLYPGLETIVRISERIFARPRPQVATNQRRPRAPRSRAVSGGLLIAFGFAQRPPPLAP